MRKLSVYLTLLAAFGIGSAAGAQECALEDIQQPIAMSAQGPGSAAGTAPCPQRSYAPSLPANSGGGASVPPEPGNYMKNWPSYSQMALQKQGSINRSGSAAGTQMRGVARTRHYVMPVHLLPGQTTPGPYASARTGMQGRAKAGTNTASSAAPVKTAENHCKKAKSAASRVMSYSSTPGVIVYNTAVSPYMTAPVRSYREFSR
ncbi:MAG: hypothetical protein K2W95_07665 [Candidatus Obscuribacterales bacterium]|nr:hypothetical protein [Candidatus Obscuribacterales bacterium]